MRRKIGLFALLACVLVLTACAAPAETTPETGETPQAETVEETAEPTPQPGSQDMAIAAYGQILESFGAPLPHEPGFPGYPEEFGEAWYEDGYLYINLTENTREMREKYRALADTPEILQFVEAAYSYNDLYALQMAIGSMMAELEISTVGVDVQENRVDVGIPDLTREAEVLEFITEHLPGDVAERFSEYPIAFEEEGPVRTA